MNHHQTRIHRFRSGHDVTFPAAKLLAAFLVLALRPDLPAAEPAPSPLFYNAVSDTKYYAKPELPKLGPAGFVFHDPTFHCPLLRVSDEQTLEGRCIVTPATGFSNPWNVDSTLFCVLADGARDIPFRFDPKTLTASRIPGLPMLPGMANEITFSRHAPNICFGKDPSRKGIIKFDFSAGKEVDFIDVGKLTGLEVGYLGTLSISANDVLALIFGGPAQNASPYVLLYDLKTSKYRVWNTKEATVDGKAVADAPHFTQHSGLIDLSGRYFVTLGPGVHGPIVWDSMTDQIYPVTTQNEGHYALGFGEMVNCTRPWVLRTALDAKSVDNVKHLVEQPSGDPYFAYDSHASWTNARPDAQAPVLVSSYHIEESGDPKCTWGDEIIALATDGSGKAWRFAHSRSTVHNRNQTPGASKGYNFWDCPRGNVSQDGRFFMFTSNWEETLGKDGQGRVREDAFIVKLESQGDGASP